MEPKRGSQIGPCQTLRNPIERKSESKTQRPGIQHGSAAGGHREGKARASTPGEQIWSTKFGRTFGLQCFSPKLENLVKQLIGRPHIIMGPPGLGILTYIMGPPGPGILTYVGPPWAWDPHLY